MAEQTHSKGPVLTHVQQPQHLPWAVYQMFFNRMRIAWAGKEIRPKSVTLRSGKGTVKKVQVGDYIYLEQNPHKDIRYGMLADKGKKVLWINNAPTGQYVGRVVDGSITQL